MPASRTPPSRPSGRRRYGALTGEHGWGLSRSHLAELALGPDLYARMEAVKRAFDPERLLNPGVIVGGHDPRALLDPRPIAAD